MSEKKDFFNLWWKVFLPLFALAVFSNSEMGLLEINIFALILSIIITGFIFSYKKAKNKLSYNIKKSIEEDDKKMFAEINKEIQEEDKKKKKNTN
jgi:hypothetical protein